MPDIGGCQMAVLVEATPWQAILLHCGLALACAMPATAPAETSRAGNEPPSFAAAPPQTTHAAWWRDGASRLRGLVGEAKRQARRPEPEWLQRRSGRDLDNLPMLASEGDVCLVLQDDRADGAELVTARYTLHETSALRAYAGAGVNRAQYFHDDPGDPGPTLFNKRNRRTSTGVAAELGAELQMAQRVRLVADVRWLDLDAHAEALRTDHGPVAAHPVWVGLSVGYRFR